MTETAQMAVSNTPVPQTLVKILIDESGSMSHLRLDTIGGVNSYIRTLKEKNEGLTHVSIHAFDSGGRITRFRTIVADRPLESVNDLTLHDYSPNGGTPLYDAVGQLMVLTEDEVSKMDPKPSVLLAILTDGGNTDHQGWTMDQVRVMSDTHQERDGWTIVYLGANQDSWAVGATLGIHIGNTMNYATSAVGETFKNLASATAMYASNSMATKSLRSADVYKTGAFFQDAGLTEEDFTEKK